MRNTLKSKKDVERLFSGGSRFHTPFLTFIVQQRSPEERFGRVAFFAGKRLGNAVWRNSAKRRMRAICSDMGGPWPEYNVIFLAKGPLLRTSYSKVLQICSKEAERIGFLSGGAAHE